MSENINKISDEALGDVTGGARRIVQNENADYVNVRYGPGTDYDVAYTLDNDTVVNTVDVQYSEYDGFSWTQLENGYWIASHLLGKIYG